MISSSPARPAFRPAITSPSCACTASLLITPASIAWCSSPMRHACSVMSVTTFAAASRRGSISCFSSWSAPTAAMTQISIASQRRERHRIHERERRPVRRVRVQLGREIRPIQGEKAGFDVKAAPAALHAEDARRRHGSLGQAPESVFDGSGTHLGRQQGLDVRSRKKERHESSPSALPPAIARRASVSRPQASNMRASRADTSFSWTTGQSVPRTT